VTTDVQVWRELLAPSSPLVDQPLELRKALIAGDFLVACDQLTALTGQMSDEAQDVTQGVCLYLEHIFFLSRNDFDNSTKALKTAQDRFRKVEDLRRLGSVVIGIAVGRLTANDFTEARDLTHAVLEPEAARSIMRGIKLRRRTLRGWIRFAIHGLLQDQYARVHNLRSVDALPRRKD
jgi:hypothetical protein